MSGRRWAGISASLGRDGSPSLGGVWPEGSTTGPLRAAGLAMPGERAEANSRFKVSSTLRPLNRIYTNPTAARISMASKIRSTQLAARSPGSSFKVGAACTLGPLSASPSCGSAEAALAANSSPLCLKASRRRGRSAWRRSSSKRRSSLSLSSGSLLFLAIFWDYSRALGPLSANGCLHYAKHQFGQLGAVEMRLQVGPPGAAHSARFGRLAAQVDHGFPHGLRLPSPPKDPRPGLLHYFAHDAIDCQQDRAAGPPLIQKTFFF